MNDQKNPFGVPEVDSSPMGIVGMEGRFFRGITGNKTPRSKGLKAALVIFSLFIFLIPGIMLLVIMVFLYPELGRDQMVGSIVPVAISLILIGCGVAGIRENIKKN